MTRVFSCGIGEVGLASIFSCHIALRYVYVLLSILVLTTYLELLLIAWTAFAFQANFMYKAVV